MQLSIKTSKKQELLDITREVDRFIQQNNISDGVLILCCPHTTAGIFVNENYDPGVAEDILDTLKRLVPSDGNYKHAEGNAHAHIKSALIGKTAMVFVENSKLQLGTWEGIFFAEFDGPRNRKLQVKIV